MSPSVMQAALQRLGYQAYRVEETLFLRLPMLSGVRVNLRIDAVEIAPRFGSLNRHTAIWVDFIAAFVLLLLALVPLPVPGAGFFLSGCAILVVLWDVCRFVLTENAATVVRAILISHKPQLESHDAA